VEPRIVPPDAPFPGIKPFSYAQRNVFFARRADVRALMRLVIVHRGVLVYAPSQRGKSSLLNAGLIPEAIAHGFQPERLRVQPVPGAECIIDRIRESESAADNRRLPSIFDSGDRDADVRVLSLAEVMARVRAVAAPADGGLVAKDAIAPAAPPAARPAVKPLLIFDQFEEWVTAFEDAAVEDGIDARALQRQILDAITSLINDHSLQVKVVLSFREDYLPRLDAFFQQAPSLSDHYLRLGPLKAKSLYKVIRGPFMRYQYPREITPATARTIQEQFNADRERAEPVLTEVQIVCRSLFEHPELVRYLEPGQAGVKGILQEYFATRLDRLGEELREASVAILTSLITPAGTRKTVDRDTLLTLASGGIATGRAVAFNALSELEYTARLIRRESRRGVDYFEISSEFLVDWIRAEAQARQAREEQRRLVEEREHAEAEAAQMAERLREQTARAEAEARMKRKLAYAFGATAALLLLTGGLLLATFMLFDATVALSREQIASTWVVAGNNELERDPQLSAILASRAADVTSTAGRPLVAAEIGLHKAVRASHLLRGVPDKVRLAAVSRGGVYVASAFGDDGVVTLRHEARFSEPDRLPPQGTATAIEHLCFSDSREMPQLIVVNSDGSVDRVTPSAQTNRRTRVLGALPAEAARPRRMVQVVCAPDATRVVLVTSMPASGGATAPAEAASHLFVTIGDLATRRWSREQTVPANHLVRLSGQGRWYTSTSPEGRVTLARAGGGNSVSRDFGRPVTATPSEDGKYVVAIPSLCEMSRRDEDCSPFDGSRGDEIEAGPKATLWFLDSSRTTEISLPNQSPIVTAAFSADGQALLLQQLGLAWAWRLPSMASVTSRPIAAEGAIFTPDSKALLTWSKEHVAELWQLEDGEERPLRLLGHADDIVSAVAATGTGPGPLVTIGDASMNVWSRRDYDVSIVTGFDYELNAVALTADGSRVAAGGMNKVLTYYETQYGTVEDGEVLDSEILALAYGHGEDNPLAVGTADGTVRVKRPGRPELRVNDARGPVTLVGFSENDELLAYSIYVDTDLNVAVVRNVVDGETVLQRVVQGQITSLVVDGAARTLRIGALKRDAYSGRPGADAAVAQATAGVESVSLARTGADTERELERELKKRDDARRELAARYAGILGTSAPPAMASLPMDLGSGAISRSGTFAVTTQRQEQLEVLRGGDESRASLRFGDRARVVTVSSDGRYFAAGGERGLLHLYAADAPRSPVTLQRIDSPLSTRTRSVVALAFNQGTRDSGSGQFLASLTSDGVIKVFHLGLSEMRARARSLDSWRRLEAHECPNEACETDVSYVQVLWRAGQRLLSFFLGDR
jgi:WD40 repeat protein